MLTATKDINAHINREDVHLKAGEPFMGSKRTGEILQSMNLLAASKPTEKKGA